MCAIENLNEYQNKQREPVSRHLLSKKIESCYVKSVPDLGEGERYTRTEPYKPKRDVLASQENNYFILPLCYCLSIYHLEINA